VEDIIRKLLDNKILSGVSLGAIGSLVTIIIMLFNNILGLPFYVMVSIFGVFAIIVTIFSIRNGVKQGTEDAIGVIREDIKKLLDVISEKDIDIKTITSYINTLETRSDLLQHSFFTSQYSEYLYKIKQILNRDGEKGQNFIIAKFHHIKLKTVKDNLENFINQNRFEIMDDSVQLNVDNLITVINNSIHEYEEKAQKEGIENIFIEDYNTEHNYIVEILKEDLKNIKHSCFTTDYNRYIAVLNAIVKAFNETFSDYHLEKIFNINGRLIDYYKEITSLLDRKIIRWEDKF
jgi:hypothetical protein